MHTMLPAHNVTTVLGGPVQSLPELAQHYALSGAHTRNALRGRSAPELSAIDRIATLLFEHYDPTSDQSIHKLAMQQIPHFYARGVLGEIDRRLAMVVKNGSRLFIQGEQAGVGTSQLVVDYARAFNKLAEEKGDSRKILYVPVSFGTKSIVRFIDDFGDAAGAVLTSAMLSGRGFGKLTKIVVAAMRSQRITTVIIDHPHHLAEPIRGVLAEIIRATDPTTRVRLSYDGHEELAPMGVVVVSHADPRQLLRGAADVLPLLEGNRVVLPKYSQPTDVRDAMRQVDIGLDDETGRYEAADMELAAAIIQLSDGLPSNMKAIFALLGAVWRNKGRRPDLAALGATVKYYDQLLGGKRAMAAAAMFRTSGECVTAPPRDGQCTVPGTKEVDCRSAGGHTEAAEPPLEELASGLMTRSPGKRSRAAELKRLNDRRTLNSKLQTEVLGKGQRARSS